MDVRVWTLDSKTAFLRSATLGTVLRLSQCFNFCSLWSSGLNIEIIKQTNIFGYCMENHNIFFVHCISPNNGESEYFPVQLLIYVCTIVFLFWKWLRLLSWKLKWRCNLMCNQCEINISKLKYFNFLWQNASSSKCVSSRYVRLLGDFIACFRSWSLIQTLTGLSGIDGWVIIGSDSLPKLSVGPLSEASGCSIYHLK